MEDKDRKCVDKEIECLAVEKESVSVFLSRVVGSYNPRIDFAEGPLSLFRYEHSRKWESIGRGYVNEIPQCCDVRGIE